VPDETDLALSRKGKRCNSRPRAEVASPDEKVNRELQMHVSTPVDDRYGNYDVDVFALATYNTGSAIFTVRMAGKHRNSDMVNPIN